MRALESGSFKKFFGSNFLSGTVDCLHCLGLHARQRLLLLPEELLFAQVGQLHPSAAAIQYTGAAQRSVQALELPARTDLALQLLRAQAYTLMSWLLSCRLHPHHQL
jgi:hypothetical protein